MEIASAVLAPIHSTLRARSLPVWERLQQGGFTDGYTMVTDVVRELRRTSQEVFMPLKQPGEAQVDDGQDTCGRNLRMFTVHPLRHSHIPTTL